VTRLHSALILTGVALMALSGAMIPASDSNAAPGLEAAAEAVHWLLALLG